MASLDRLLLRQHDGGPTRGQWQSLKLPRLIHLLRGMVRLLECRFQVVAGFHHVAAHQGDPGNEAADAAAEGSPLGEWSHFPDYATTISFVGWSEWFWMLFYMPHGAWSSGVP